MLRQFDLFHSTPSIAVKRPFAFVMSAMALCRMGTSAFSRDCEEFIPIISFYLYVPHCGGRKLYLQMKLFQQIQEPAQ